MNYIKATLPIIAFLSIAIIESCENNADLLSFSIDDDVALGMKVDAAMESDPVQFPILDRTQHAKAYAILDGILQKILNSDTITHRDKFLWKLHIINDDQILNAFAAPGGYIYIYSGLMYFLDREDDLAAIISHEVAHAERRHISKALQRQFSVAVLTEALNGGQPEMIQQIIGSLVGTEALKFSRDAAIEADNLSVEYLSDTDYACNGAASFFKKLTANQEAFNPEFLSTHPGSNNRIENINKKAASIRCDTTFLDADGSKINALKALLP
ncbi:MAG: M48 family metalloprotease [Ekhidna sp.]|nr:M48 family metalloprotease [Ekhidna sp.]